MKNNCKDFFLKTINPVHKKYEALRAFYVDNKNAEEVAKMFRYKLNSVYSLTKEFMEMYKAGTIDDYFFTTHAVGRKQKALNDDIYELIISLRKQYLSVPDIKAIIDPFKQDISEKYIYKLLKKEGFARLPRRNKQTKQAINNLQVIPATKSELLKETETVETFDTANSIGVLCLLPYIQNFGIDKLIEQAEYPGTKTIPCLNSILSFIALKLSNVRRYTADDLWCMDRGLGLFAGLNVLPKSSWFTSYSHRVTRKMNMRLLNDLCKLWKQNGLLSDTANLDFATVPYWGDDDNLENNWSGTRHKALASILVALAQDPATGIITYGDTTVRHNNKAEVAVEFLDFYKENNADLKYLVFDSKFTTYVNLSKLDDNDVKFITIRQRGKNVVELLKQLSPEKWITTRVAAANGKSRLLKVYDSTITLKDYGKEIRQIAITGHGKIKPALIITNDFKVSRDEIIKKYAQRWLVEKEISEQIYFFHLNSVSSSMVIKVDFDLTMTIFAHNLLRLLAIDLPGYTNNTAITLYEKFLCNSGYVTINNDTVTISMKKKKNLPLILTAMERFQNCNITWLHNKKIKFIGASNS